MTRRNILSSLFAGALSLTFIGKRADAKRINKPQFLVKPDHGKPEFRLHLVSDGTPYGALLCDDDGRVFGEAISVSLSADARDGDAIFADVSLCLSSVDIRGECDGQHYRFTGSVPENRLLACQDMTVRDGHGKRRDDVVAFDFTASGTGVELQVKTCRDVYGRVNYS